jgi:chromosome segregation ATPase
MTCASLAIGAELEKERAMEDFDVDVHVHLGSRDEVRRIEDALATLVQLLEKMMATFDQVLAEVTDEDTRLDSLDTLIQGLKKQINDALTSSALSSETQTKLDAVWGALQNNKAKIDAALNANVPPVDVPPVAVATPMEPPVDVPSAP